MIKSFRSKALRKLYEEDSEKGLDANHVPRLRAILTELDVATRPEDVAVPAWNLHPLKGDEKGVWALKVDENWRVTFTFDGVNVVLLDYRDYH